MPSQTFGLFEAKTHFSELVARAEHGDEVIITRHNKPVARIVPMGKAQKTQAASRSAAIDALLAFEPIDVPDATMRDLIDEGRA